MLQGVLTVVGELTAPGLHVPGLTVPGLIVPGLIAPLLTEPRVAVPGLATPGREVIRGVHQVSLVIVETRVLGR